MKIFKSFLRSSTLLITYVFFSTTAYAESTFFLDLKEKKEAIQIFKENCKSCHGRKGKGGFAKFKLDFQSGDFQIPNIKGVVPSDEYIFKIISEGIPNTRMESFSNLTERKRRLLVRLTKFFITND